ncbi:MAG: hypothetical protein M3517_03460 [Actinomycetota bacterium]|nr:hypothetical protein [Actinomycetota bacterium]
MLGDSPCRISDRPVRLAELGRRDAEEIAPELGRTFEIKALVQVRAHPKSCLVDVEMVSKPDDEHPKQCGIGVGHPHLTIALEPFPGVERGPGEKELSVGHLTDLGDAFGVEALDLGDLPHVQAARPWATSPPSWVGHEVDVADPEAHRRLRDTQLGGNVLQRPRLGTQLSRSELLRPLATVTHAASMRPGCDGAAPPVTDEPVTPSRGTRAGVGPARAGAAWRAS